jgi:hypothetical protein
VLSGRRDHAGQECPADNPTPSPEVVRLPLSAVVASAHVAWANRYAPHLLQPWVNR